ncbi:DUF2877 domain-containing protein [Sinomonas sp. JGH33]|uniref:DUF2877 domain-containing protein n=1 Tax=Sinomonas terricola TaxID=3110330 RepID=A0ABU5T276_9MICC|nr:DUF2877 domain-containing protein [Sinomonas sp. JGH33]MEA5453768.1 DUF2877 domain-containing protein [Sinomonas sp. JGH33]
MDARLASVLAEWPRIGRLHSVFARVVNVLAPSGRLISLSADSLDDAPWTIRVATVEWEAFGLEVGAAVVLEPRRITLVGVPGVVLDLRNISKWYSSLPAAGLMRLDVLTHRATALERLLDARGVRGGILPAASAAPIDAEIGRRLRAGCERLTEAIREDDDGAARLAAQSLLGLGPGLTPAGDDFMAGLALVAAVPGTRLGAVSRVLRAVLDGCPDQTTLVSRTTLREAVDGRARESLLGILNRVFAAPRGDEAQFAEHLRVPMERALGIGHTSGTDILSGLVAGLRLEIELRGSM